MSAKLLAMSLNASASSVRGTFQQHVLIDGRHELVTDEPVRLGGQGSGPAPHELLPAGLASCIATTVAAFGRRRARCDGRLKRASSTTSASPGATR
jgi:uncharacterized OsmC-like protein